MKCELNCKKHSKFKSYGRRFIEFWHEYFQSTGISVRDLPIKGFLSAIDLVKLNDLSVCSCKNLVKTLYPDPSFICNYCQKSFSTMTELNLHLAEMKISPLPPPHLHQQKKRFQCFFCTKCLVSKATLLQHMERHTKNYECVKITRGHSKPAKNRSNHQRQSSNRI